MFEIACGVFNLNINLKPCKATDTVVAQVISLTSIILKVSRGKPSLRRHDHGCVYC